MDMIDILGGMLGHKSSRGSKGSDVLKDMFGRGSRSSEQQGPIDISREAKELEDMLNVAHGRRSSPTRSSSPSDRRPAPTPHRTSPSSGPDQNDRALILVRAMANAAKADGRIDQAEQQSILNHIKNPSAEVIQFLQDEFRRPLDVQGFARSVPAGMEQQVYMLSLIAMDLDTGDEAKYLMQLSEALRLTPEVRQQIHERVGAPNIF
jgi:hypothetical protein